MKLFVFLFLLVNGASAVTHSLKYFYTASSGIPNFPEFVSLGMVDDAQITYCDSNTNKNGPKQDWMNKVTVEDPQYWDHRTQSCLARQPVFKANIDIVKKRLNQTGGVHVFQIMYGCEWDEETGEVKGYRQFGYDGEDFLSFDLETETWIAPKPEGLITKHKWDNDKAFTAQRKNYLTQECPEWLKKYVNYGRSSLMRKDIPSVSLLQKTPSSPVSCHATGFYPDRAMMFWRKDGEEIDEGVEHGEILPNHDGSFQMKVDLDVSSVSPEDWTRYDCVFQLSGVEDDIITRLESKRGDREFPPAAVIGVVVALLLLLAACVAGLIIWRRRNNGFKRTNTSDTSSSSAESPEPEKEKAPLA